jgi:hypothetical protein
MLMKKYKRKFPTHKTKTLSSNFDENLDKRTIRIIFSKGKAHVSVTSNTHQNFISMGSFAYWLQWY